MEEVHAAVKVAGLGFGEQGLSLPIVFWVQASLRSPFSTQQHPYQRTNQTRHHRGAGSSGHHPSGPSTPQGLANVTFPLTAHILSEEAATRTELLQALSFRQARETRPCDHSTRRCFQLPQEGQKGQPEEKEEGAAFNEPEIVRRPQKAEGRWVHTEGGNWGKQSTKVRRTRHGFQTWVGGHRGQKGCGRRSIWRRHPPSPPTPCLRT